MCEKCNKGKYYITTAIAYASGKPHIGNTYEVVLADAIASFLIKSPRFFVQYTQRNSYCFSCKIINFRCFL